MGSGTRIERQALLATAFDEGVTHFDVAPLYGLGYAEKELGEFIKRLRDKVTVTTKFGILPQPLATAATIRMASRLGASRFAARFDAFGHNRRAHRFAPQDAQASLESSLRRLKSDYIDILLLHDCGLQDAREDGLVQFLESSKTAGKIRAYGVATGIGEVLEIERTLPTLTRIVQIENSLLRQNVQRLQRTGQATLITHRSLSESYRLVGGWLRANPEQRARWSVLIGEDVGQPQCLSRIMLEYAARANGKGTILFSTRDHARVRPNIRALTENSFPESNWPDIESMALRSAPQIELSESQNA